METLSALLSNWPHSDGRGATIALVDSGVETSHPALAGASIECVALSFEGEAAVARPCEGRDVGGHGTACAARILSIAPAARILSCRVLSQSLQATSRQLIASLEWLAQREDLDVVNLSLGTPNRALGLEIAHAVDRFYARGIPLVASSGPSQRPDYPAVFSGPVSVASADCGDQELVYRPGDLVEFGACGEARHVPWAGGGYLNISGSSFAAPLVAGRLARFKALNRTLTVWELKTLLQHQARPPAI
jgi:subtilisin